MTVLSLSEESPFLVELQRVVFRSFHLAQGDKHLHLLLSQYVALQHDWSISPEQVARLQTRLVPVCKAFITGNWHVPVDGALIEYEVFQQLGWLAQAFARRDRLPKREDILAGIIEHCLDRDFLFLCTRKGRPRAPQTQQTPGTIHAPFFSHLCQYGLLHRPTGAMVFDALFTEIAVAFEQRSEIFARCFAGEVARQCLEQVLAVHNRQYPAQPVRSWFT